MRSPEEVFEEIENDRAHRQGEIRLIENIAARTESDLRQTCFAALWFF